MKNKLTLLCGIPASGKSTYASEQFKKDNKLIIVSREKIRMLLFGYNDHTIYQHYNSNNFQKLEDVVSEYQHELITHAVNANKSVIVDDMNLKLSYIRKFHTYNIETDIIIFKDSLDVNKCIERDSKRINKVGADKILLKKQKFDMLLKNLNIEPLITKSNIYKITNYNFGKEYFKYIPNKDFKERPLKQCVIVDLDSTIANNNERNPYDYTRVLEDKPIEKVIDLVKLLKQGCYKIVICTGRSNMAKEDTLLWLYKHNVPFDEFYIREKDDNRKDYIVKSMMWKKIIEKYNVAFMIDDRRQVIDHARSCGFLVFDVANNTF